MVKIGRGHQTLAGFVAPRAIEPKQLRMLVHQAIDRACSPQDRDAILRVALLNAGERDIPLDSALLTAFVLGPLHDAVVDFDDGRAADQIIESLRPLLKMKSQIDLDDGQDAESDEAADEVRRRVLVVGDEVRVRAQVVRMLNEAGYQAASAPDANVALAMCVRQRPDAVVAEIHSAAMSGKRLHALLRVAFGLEAPPLVLLAAGDVDESDPGSSAAIVAKPVTQAALLAALEPLLE